MGGIMRSLFSDISMAVLILLSSHSFSHAFRLPDSGKSKCYDSAGREIACPPSGQDGAYSINTMSFSDNGNGTLSDNRTGLMWQRNEGGTMKWDAALSHCEGLSLGEHQDWRLPNIKELESLTDDGAYNPVINGSFFPNAVAGKYWSLTSNSYSASLAWAVEFFSGSADNRWAKPNFDYNVPCVRNDLKPPPVTTAALSAITQRSVTGGGNVTFDGWDTVTAWGGSAVAGQRILFSDRTLRPMATAAVLSQA
jgi:hypothetical protein